MLNTVNEKFDLNLLSDEQLSAVRNCVESLREKNCIFTDTDGKTYTGDRAIAKSLNVTVGQARALLQRIYKQEV